MCMCACVYACMCVHVCVCMGACMCVHVCLCTCAYMCACVCDMHACLRVCVCVAVTSFLTALGITIKSVQGSGIGSFYFIKCILLLVATPCSHYISSWNIFLYFVNKCFLKKMIFFLFSFPAFQMFSFNFVC